MIKITDGAGFQDRVQPWLMACFGAEIAADKLERLDRFLEEVLELCQAQDYPEWRIDAIKRYTFDRPQGDINQELGGVMVTLAALCLANDLDMHASGETELSRVSTPEMIAKIRAKQAAKPKFSPLPVVALAALPEGGDGNPLGDQRRQNGAIRDALVSCRAIIADLPAAALGTSGDGDGASWLIRDEVLMDIDRALAFPSPPSTQATPPISPLCDDAGGGT